MNDARLQERTLKSDLFGEVRIELHQGEARICRDLGRAHPLLRGLARWLARREARGLEGLGGLADVPVLLVCNRERLERSYLAGAPMYERPPHGDLAYFRKARRLLQALHRRGVVHNDLAKEANWLVQDDGRPAIVDFQLAVRGSPRSAWFRLLAREDLRHLLKHKRSYCPQAITAVERRLLKRPSWLRNLWFRTGKPVYRFITRRLLGWRDNEGRGPRP